MELGLNPRGEDLVVHVGATRIDAASAIAFKDKMRDATAGGQGRVILDLQRVDLIDSSGLGAIVAVMKLLGADRPLLLCALSPKVTKVLSLTRMDRVFGIYPDVPSALKAASNAA